MPQAPLLIIFAGLPGTGKTTLARALAGKLEATYLRIDTIEQAIRDSGTLAGSIDDAGYRVGYAVAEENLRLGRTVVADAVNDVHIARDSWLAAAARARAKAVEIEVLCSNAAEHRRRVESRQTDIPGLALPGLALPGWQEVSTREYQPWNRDHLVIDTANQSIDASLAMLDSLLSKLSSLSSTSARQEP